MADESRDNGMMTPTEIGALPDSLLKPSPIVHSSAEMRNSAARLDEMRRMKRSRARTASQLVAVLLVAITAGLLAGWRFFSSKKPQAEDWSQPVTIKWFPEPGEVPAAELSSTQDSAVVEARRRAIHQLADAIRSESQTAGGWERWQRDTAVFRAALKAKTAALKPMHPTGLRYAEDEYAGLEGLNEFPLFEVGSRAHLRHVFDPESLNEFRQQRPVLAAHRWLKARGIDLIFIPVPKMTEIYVEHFVEGAPADGVIAPHLRQTLLELLENDVEVLDAFRILRPHRAPAPDYLYNTADTHWAPRAMRIMAKAIADRLERYPDCARHRYALPIFTATVGRYGMPCRYPGVDAIVPDQNGWTALTLEQQRRAARVQTTSQVIVALPESKPIHNDPKSSVMAIGHSYLYNFIDQLDRELNMLTAYNAGANNTTEAFSDFLRDPELLAHTRVVVWITTGKHMTEFKPMPPAIMAALK
jgi:hypothetical protein